MDVTQTYSCASQATTTADGLAMHMAADLGGPPVRLQAEIANSAAYAACMLALYEVVTSDLRTPQKDHSAYQAWVRERYLEALPSYTAAKVGDLKALTVERAALQEQVANLRNAVRELCRGPVFYEARGRYWRWAYMHDRDAWMLFDPVVSAHHDALIFEGFSLDESSYGRVTVPAKSWQLEGEVACGCTNIDFSHELAQELRRVRSYRPARISVGKDTVGLATDAGSAVEKKIALPPSWVRGFLQVQAASAFAQTELQLSSETVAEILAALRERRERESPRSLRFQLTPGKRPMVVIEPWGVAIAEPRFKYAGSRTTEIRVWGRRRLLTLEALLPLTDSVEVRLLGTGMPSYWSVTYGQHRFDLGLSGWTRNDWAGGAAFDELVSAVEVREGDVKLAATHLRAAMAQTPKTLAAELGIDRKLAQAAMQRLCARGLAMYDAQARCFRWRPLFEGMPTGVEEQASHMATAKRLLAAEAVQALELPSDERDGQVWNLLVSGRREQQVRFRLDADGKLQDAHCSCSIFRRDKLRKGACPHILAAKLFVGRQV